MKLIPPEEYLGRGLRASPQPHTVPLGREHYPVGTFRYFRLTCGHLTTPEEQERWRAWRPKSKGRGVLYFCDVSSCSKWFPKEPEPKPVSLPQEPMF